MLTLDPRGDGVISTRFQIDGTPMAEAAQMTLAWQVPGGILPGALWSAVQEIWPLLERVQAGHSEDLDTQSRRVGVLTPDAAEADLEIYHWLDERNWGDQGEIAPVISLDEFLDDADAVLLGDLARQTPAEIRRDVREIGGCHLPVTDAEIAAPCRAAGKR